MRAPPDLTPEKADRHEPGSSWQSRPGTFVVLRRRRATASCRRIRQVLVSISLFSLVGLVTSVASPSRAAEADFPEVRFLLTWGKEGVKPGEFHFPIGIAIDSADLILITDHYNHRVQQFDREGKLVA